MAVVVARVEYNQPLCSRCKFVALKTKKPAHLAAAGQIQIPGGVGEGKVKQEQAYLPGMLQRQQRLQGAASRPDMFSPVHFRVVGCAARRWRQAVVVDGVKSDPFDRDWRSKP